MLNRDFCEFLEYEITKALKANLDERLKGSWCDGVLLPHSENEYSKKHVNDKRQIVMTAFSGKSGQDQYELVLHFGRKAISRYARDLSIKEYLPDIDCNWLEVDPVNKQMLVQLD
ncbi:MAG TPA: hypothetical protein VNS32_20390 [Flavisolibacter sp.]|nr:hypothetical protein [Flavisolibacter sp.]